MPITRMRRSWAALVLIVTLGIATAVAIAAGNDSSRRDRPLRIRSEVIELQRQVAVLRAAVGRLESQLAFQARQDAAETAPTGMCGDPCAEDSDGDALLDCEDPCPCDAQNTDGDADGVPDCADPCPDDPTDACTDPCRMDSDGDGLDDCHDPCPYDAAQPVDVDADGVVDCQDPCPQDPANECAGPCPELDQDGDGVYDCTDPCPMGEEPGMPCVGASKSGTVKIGSAVKGGGYAAVGPRRDPAP